MPWFLRFGLDEVRVNLGAEGGAERDDERREALDGLAVQQQVDRAKHRAAEGDVGKDSGHHRFHEIALEGAALKILPVRHLLFRHAKDAVGRAAQHAIICCKIFGAGEWALVDGLMVLNNVAVGPRACGNLLGSAIFREYGAHVVANCIKVRCDRASVSSLRCWRDVVIVRERSAIEDRRGTIEQ